MIPNFSGSQVSGTRDIGRTQVRETQLNSVSPQITVLRAHNLPTPRRRRFYATVTDGTRAWQTQSVQSVGNRVEWNENVDTFAVQPLSRITVSLYAKRTIRKDLLVGRQEIVCESQCERVIIFGGADGHAGGSAEPTTPYLTIAISTNAISSVIGAANNPNPGMAEQDNPVAEGGAAHPAVQANNETMQPMEVTTPLPPLSRTVAPPTESGTPMGPVADSQAEMSRTLDHAGEVMDMIKSWESTVGVIKLVMDTVGPIAELTPHSNLPWKLLSKVPETLLHQFQRDDNVRTLLQAIRDAFEFTKVADVLRNIHPASTQAKILDEMLQCVSECAEFIESYAKDVQVGKRTLKNIGGKCDAKVENYRTTLIRLRENFLTHANVITGAAVLQIRDDVRTQLTEKSSQALETEISAIIGETPFIGGWRFNDKKGCHPGTRQDFLGHIIEWVENPESDRGLVLLGQAGTGKSSIAHEVAYHFDNICLGSYAAFRRKEQTKDEAYHLFTTLARDLSDRYPSFKLALGRVVTGNSSLRSTRDYRRLFERLLLEPFKTLQLGGGPILIVIDALDESGVAIGKNGLHTFLAQRLIDLPPNFRILITSRPDDGIEPAFANARSVRTLYIDDAQLAANTEQDIGVYLQNELPEDVFEAYGGKLAKAAEGLFQWAAVASGFINGTGSLGLSNSECVRRLLGHSRGRHGEGLLDNLYEEVLKEYFKSDEAQVLFRSVMGQLFAASEPLSMHTLIALRRHAPIVEPEDSDRVPKILRHLGSLLSNITSSEQKRPIVPLHTSFRDFLTNKTSNVFYVDLADAHHQLAHSCLGLMLDELKFNICNLESSYLANSDVPDLESRIAEHIPPALSYACVYWDHHLKHLVFDHKVFTKLQSLFETKFLFWLEVLSIKSCVGLASPALSSLLIWLQRELSQTEVKNLLALVNDASSFVRYFGMAMARSAPHIYISALPFAPSSSRIHNQYVHDFPQTLTLERGQLPHWPALEMTIPAHEEEVLSVAFSPDGQRIASASADRTIRVWNATTGEVVAGPFTGHTNSVNSAVFSPDGQHIASASSDLTIRVWDSATGQVVADPFRGHTKSVNSVAFSPDGQCIASASGDRTIRVWDAATGHVVADPFTGHTKSVNSVAFSPDGQCIASASEDDTIRVWDAATGHVVAGPFTGHAASVKSVAFSPDGQHIASASDDCTIRVWDAATGQVVAGPFAGHADWARSVTFSPDGQRIASASDDGTIRMWDAATGQVVGAPFTGHTNWVLSVAFSPDGQRIASASYDCTIRVWGAATGQVVAGPFTGHEDLNEINSVAFSPNGQRIASASVDHTIRLWDAATGQVVADPFIGHTDLVLSVVFSPDGQRIASASSDCTIRVWNAATGQVVVDPFTGHTGWVACVAFSPDGQRIISASGDGMICVWDAATGEVVVGPFTGHTNQVNSVAFSPDGQRIASASNDHTIRVWDAVTGEVAAGPFAGHTTSVNSIAFSPNGQRIASASGDCTICVWDSATGQIVAGPFTEHTDSVLSVAFSPDGRRIASASRDCTIRMWDAATGQVVAGPFHGHTRLVSSVAFSPDGRRIVSASYDRTIRMWNTANGQVVAGSFTSNAFSPGGQNTAPALGDPAIQVETKNIEKIHFTDQSLINSDGWIYGEEKELLLWIPELHRTCLHRPSTVWIAGGHDTRLDFSKFVHGPNWVTVHEHNRSR